MAHAIGVRQAAYCRYETGHRVPRPEVMRRIVAVTGGAVRPDDFFGLPAPPHPDPLPRAGGEGETTGVAA